MHVKGLMLGFALLLFLSGCQCCPRMDCYYDVIDDVSESSPWLDRFYHPGLDLSRIGQPDWCASSINRFWCESCCDDGCY